MLKNYIVIGFRNLLKNKVFSLINILGLSLGISCCLLLALYIQHEIAFDQHHKRLEDLYRITTHFQSNDGLKDMRTTSPPIAMVLASEVPEIETATRVVSPPDASQSLIKYQDKVFYETEGFVADSTFFDVFTYDFIAGNPATALVQANSVVITDRLAKKLFGNEPALDKLIAISQGGPSTEYKITGVIKDQQQSHIHANFFISMTSTTGFAEYIRTNSEEWAGQNFMLSYLKLQPGHDATAVLKKMNRVLMKHGAADMKAMGVKKTLGLEPLGDIYLRSDLQGTPHITQIYIVGSIAVFILLLACINFMNLSTAKASRRAGEIGIRKVMGAFRSSLIMQILGEAMVIVIMAILIGLVLMQGALPYFNTLTGKTISFNASNTIYFAAALLLITMITGLIAGSYPAFYLSSFQPSEVLKGKMKIGNASSWLRQGLVVFQFAIAIVLVCGMILMSQQLNFMQTRELGFDVEAKVVLPLRTATGKAHYITLKNEFMRKGLAEQVSAAEYIPGSYMYQDFSVYKEGGSMEKSILQKINWVDHDYIGLMGMSIIAGRNFSDNYAADGRMKVIINRVSAKALGFTPEAAVGQPLFAEWNGERATYEVIGVVEDYHQVSLHEKIEPSMFRLPDEPTGFANMIITVKPDDFKDNITEIERTWKAIVNDTPFEYTFLDENVQKQYAADQTASRIITTFSVIAMFISCMGLYGLSTFMAERRFKEIGVRKVMGASVSHIIRLMSGEFVKLIAIAFVLAVPVAWYMMNQWLNGFAYKVSLELPVFLYAGAGALFIALVTISFESLKAASTNPVKSLRAE